MVANVSSYSLTMHCQHRMIMELFAGSGLLYLSLDKRLCDANLTSLYQMLIIHIDSFLCIYNTSGIEIVSAL